MQAKTFFSCGQGQLQHVFTCYSSLPIALTSSADARTIWISTRTLNKGVTVWHSCIFTAKVVQKRYLGQETNQLTFVHSIFVMHFQCCFVLKFKHELLHCRQLEWQLCRVKEGGVTHWCFQVGDDLVRLRWLPSQLLGWHTWRRRHTWSRWQCFICWSIILFFLVWNLVCTHGWNHVRSNHGTFCCKKSYVRQMCNSVLGERGGLSFCAHQVWLTHGLPVATETSLKLLNVKHFLCLGSDVQFARSCCPPHCAPRQGSVLCLQMKFFVICVVTIYLRKTRGGIASYSALRWSVQWLEDVSKPLFRDTIHLASPPCMSTEFCTPPLTTCVPVVRDHSAQTASTSVVSALIVFLTTFPLPLDAFGPRPENNLCQCKNISQYHDLQEIETVAKNACFFPLLAPRASMDCAASLLCCSSSAASPALSFCTASSTSELCTVQKFFGASPVVITCVKTAPKYCTKLRSANRKHTSALT